MSCIRESGTFVTACRNREIGAGALGAGGVDVGGGIGGGTPLHESKPAACVADLKGLVLDWVERSLPNERRSYIGRNVNMACSGTWNGKEASGG